MHIETIVQSAANPSWVPVAQLVTGGLSGIASLFAVWIAVMSLRAGMRDRLAARRDNLQTAFGEVLRLRAAFERLADALKADTDSEYDRLRQSALAEFVEIKTYPATPDLALLAQVEGRRLSGDGALHKSAEQKALILDRVDFLIGKMTEASEALRSDRDIIDRRLHEPPHARVKTRSRTK